jgi:hypothetical protein
MKEKNLDSDLKKIKDGGNGYLIVFVTNGAVSFKHMTISEEDKIRQKKEAIQAIEELSNEEAAWVLHRIREEIHIAGLTKKIFKAAGIEKNWEMIPFELDREYTWKEFFEYDENQNKIPKKCTFKVTKMEKDKKTLSGYWCHVTYIKGPYAGTSVKIPLEDMPPTIEKRT